MSSHEDSGTQPGDFVANRVVQFSRETWAHVGAFNNVETFLRRARIASAKRFNQLLDQHGEVIEEGEVSKYRIRDAYENLKVKNQRTQLDGINAALGITPKALFLGLMATYEALTLSLVEHYVRKYPEQFLKLDVAIPLTEVFGFESLDELRDSLVEAEIVRILRLSRYEQMKHFRGQHGVKLDLNDTWPRFIEAAERRNCHAHNGGRVSFQYLETTADVKYKHDDELKVGDHLPISRAYFERTAEIVLQTGVALAITLGRHFDGPEAASPLANAATDVALELISGGSNSVGLGVLTYGEKSLIADLDNGMRMVFRLNIAQAHKWCGRSSECERLLGEHDWSGVAERFVLAVHVLRDEFDAAEALMPRTCGLGHDRVSERALFEWPIFREFRKTEQFRRGFEAAFGKAPHPELQRLDETDAEPADRERLEGQPEFTDDAE